MTNSDGSQPIYRVKLMFEWGGGCLWADDDAAHERFGVGAIEDALPLTPETRRRLEELSAWHDGALNWDDPAAPSPWHADEQARFARAAEEMLATLRADLGPGIELSYRPL
jgi:hypothetical protein